MPRKAIVPFSADHMERIAAISHVVYEYANLIAAGYYSIRGAAPWRTNCDDAFLLGCRKLDDFLMRDKRSVRGDKEQDDVLALDYLPLNFDPAKNRNWELPIWSQWREAMNKQLAHIAYKRDKAWDHTIWVPQLEPEFRTAWAEFRKSITDPDYNQEFDRQLKAKSGGLSVNL